MQRLRSRGGKMRRTMKKFRRPIRNYFLSKIVGMFLVGTLHAAVAQQPSPKVIQFAHAIAQAEGYSLKGSIPQRCNNPGDLKGTKFAGQVGVCKGGHARFRTSRGGLGGAVRPGREDSRWHVYEIHKSGNISRTSQRHTRRTIARGSRSLLSC